MLILMLIRGLCWFQEIFWNSAGVLCGRMGDYGSNSFKTAGSWIPL